MGKATCTPAPNNAQLYGMIEALRDRVAFLEGLLPAAMAGGGIDFDKVANLTELGQKASGTKAKIIRVAANPNVLDELGQPSPTYHFYTPDEGVKALLLA